MIKNKRDLSVLIGNALGHYDISIYGLLVPIIAPLFFPKHEYVVQLILGYSIYFTSLLSKPMGIIIFSLLAEKKGATYALSYSLIGVGISSLIIGFLPTFKTIGIVSPIILVISLMIRDVFSSGEAAIAKFYILENKSLNESKSLSFIYQSSNMGGIILASGLVTLLIYTNQAQEYWRIAFWLGGLIAVFGAYLRKNIEQIDGENTKFKIKLQDLKTLVSIANKSKINIGKIAIATIFGYMTYSIPFVFLNSFAPLITKISLSEMMEWNTYLLVFDFIALMVLGQKLKKFDHIKVMKYSALILAISIIPLFYFIQGANLLYLTFVRIYIVMLGVAFSCFLNIWAMDLFGAKDKYFCTGIGSIIGGSTFGKMSTAICLSMWHYTGISTIPALYVAFFSLVTFFIINPKPENKH